MKPNSIKSFGGGVFSLPIPEVGEVSIIDVAHCLAGIGRWNGRVDYPGYFFSVGQHSMEVSTLCARYAKDWDLNEYEAALAGLLHDSPEYTYGDIINPVKHRMGPEFKELKKAADDNVYKALGVTDIMERCHKLVKWADLEMLVSDAARWNIFCTLDLLDGPVTISKHHVVPHPFILRFPDAVPFAPGVSKKPFLEVYTALRAKVFGEKS